MKFLEENFCKAKAKAKTRQAGRQAGRPFFTQGLYGKPVLLATTALMLVSGGMVAFALNYLTLMVRHAVLGIAIGG